MYLLKLTNFFFFDEGLNDSSNFTYLICDTSVKILLV